MSTTPKRPHADTLRVAERLSAHLRPACDRLMIAGSLRRQKPMVGDIEIVVTPKPAPPLLDLFGQPLADAGPTPLDDVLAALGVSLTKNGPRYKQFSFDGVQVDLFLASVETWGCVATIRTGSAEFTRWLVTARRVGGACPAGMKFSEGRLYDCDRLLDTPEERDVFAALGVGWVEPTERVEGWVR